MATICRAAVCFCKNRFNLCHPCAKFGEKIRRQKKNFTRLFLLLIAIYTRSKKFLKKNLHFIEKELLLLLPENEI
jgi:hypothetical protein